MDDRPMIDAVQFDERIFEFILEGAITQEQVAREAAKGLSVFASSARDNARQRRMNQMVENAIIQIEEMTNVTVACIRNETINGIPFPPHIDKRQTMLNFRNRR